MLPRATPTSEDRTFRKKRRRKGSRPQFRIADLNRLFSDRYGDVLPDDDAGRGDIAIMLHHQAHRMARNVVKIMHVWLDRRAPWFVGDERDRAIAKAVANPIAWKAARLGAELRLTDADRSRLGITTIRAIDVTEAERAQRRAQKEVERKARKRRTAGCRTKAEIAERSMEVAKLCAAEGISRRTYFRRQARQKEAEKQSPRSATAAACFR
jgi:hypothetical protein